MLLSRSVGLKVDRTRAKPHPGGVPRLSPRQKQRLLQELVQGPRAAGYATEVWTCPRVAALIVHRFGVRYQPAHVWRLLQGIWLLADEVSPARTRNLEEKFQNSFHAYEHRQDLRL